ncbi:MAG: hypothetical protein R3C39_01870 [Dehalococcoidia bacterium]
MSARPTIAPDPAWRGLYRAGAVAALLYVVFVLIVPTVMFVDQYDRGMDGQRLLQYIAEHRGWWIALQTLVLPVASVLLIIVLGTVYVSLARQRSWQAAIGGTLGIASQIVWIAYYPVTLGLVFLADYHVDADAERRVLLAGGAEGLIAIIDAFNPIYEAIFAIGVSLLSVAMLRGPYPRWLARLGVAIGPAAVASAALWPLIEVGYLWWWILVAAWLIGVGWQLYRLGGAQLEVSA